ncbi:uncharacterized protein LOC131183313 [Hevea brasiliensis]|uniref:uncharacterized protein LOC131183313 n=1 Tax=Hevea brasiliensis TaxID=3981 RepID=UPI0025CFB609|nr:uncharacterized protein LOC131183313 [Hevea brasiliensis]
MALRIERKGEIHNSVNEDFNTAMIVKAYKDVGGNKFQSKKKDARKENRTCNYCNATGHTRDTCFRLHGYPDWWTDYKTKKGKERVNIVTQIPETPLNASNEVTQRGRENMNMDLYNIIQQEIERFMSNQNNAAPSSNAASCVSFTDFEGPSD